MSQHVTQQELADWRYQCDERIRRWKQQRATPHWHLAEQDLLRILDELAAARLQTERAEAARDRLRSEWDRLQKGCPACIKGEPARALLDCDGVLASVSRKPGQWGHSWDDFHWYCADAGAIAENTRLREALEQGIAGLSVIPLPHAEHVADRMRRALGAPSESPSNSDT